MEILYQDDDIFVLNKPSGLPVLPDGWEKDAPYLVKLLEEQYDRVWIVHRLDKGTSGVMVFARNADAHRRLNIQFEEHIARKIYHAIMVGVPPWEEKIARHLLRANVGHKHRTMVDDRKGKPSETRFKILKRYASYVLSEAVLMTGRTHQIRVHAFALGYPLLGDTLYGALPSDLILRPALHAYSLSFLHPLTQGQLSFTASYPPDFEQALEQLS